MLKPILMHRPSYTNWRCLTDIATPFDDRRRHLHAVPSELLTFQTAVRPPVKFKTVHVILTTKRRGDHHGAFTIVWRQCRLHFLNSRSDSCLKPFEVLERYQFRLYFLKMVPTSAEIRRSISVTWCMYVSSNTRITTYQICTYSS